MKLQLHYSNRTTLKPKVNKVQQTDSCYANKPKGGFWTSSYRKKTGSSDWYKHLQEINNRDRLKKSNHVHLLQPNELVNLFVIESYDDVMSLYEKYPLKDNDCKLIDFVEISRNYDGINLTRKGLKDTKRKDEEHRYNDPKETLFFAYWSCESTVWFNWKFDKWNLIK
jgi:hypothetical protein